MRHATLWRYAIRMEAGVILRNQRLKQREGLLVTLSEGANTGWGEIAPLPGFSHESLDDARIASEAWLSCWCRQRNDSLPDSTVPSVAFGISCAQAELAGQLPAQGQWQTAALCTGDPDDLLLRLSQQPCRVAKMKVGLYEAVRDGMMVTLLLEAVPDLHLRLDANRSWTLEKARQFTHYVPVALRPRIDFIEEPCRTPTDSRQFAGESGIALAWDETVHDPDFVVQAEPGVAAIVIKPTLTGSLARVKRLVMAAHQQGLSVVISSALESSLALTQLARVAGRLTPDAVPGLDTLALMQQQVVRSWPGCSLPVLSTEDMQCLWQS